MKNCRTQNLDIPRARRGRARPGRAGRGGAPMRRLFMSTFRAPNTTVLDASPEAQTKEILCKPDQGTQRPVDERFISGTRSILRSWMLTNGPPPSSLCEPFSCKACPGTRPGNTTSAGRPVEVWFICGTTAALRSRLLLNTRPTP